MKDGGVPWLYNISMLHLRLPADQAKLDSTRRALYARSVYVVNEIDHYTPEKPLVDVFPRYIVPFFRGHLLIFGSV